MKRVTFEGEGDFALTIQPDFSDSGEDDGGLVRVQSEGIDVEEVTTQRCLIYGFFSPDEAREIARYLVEMAQTAERGRA